MSHTTAVVEAITGQDAAHPPALSPTQMLIDAESHLGQRSVTFLVSMLLHSVLVLAIVLVPLLFYDSLPSQDSLKAFFVRPLELAPPPPPPPPPSAATAVVRQAPRVVQETHGFVAPIEIPNEVKPEEGLDLGAEGGVAGGVEGGVPGGVVGGIVGGLPTALPPPPAAVVRIGGKIAAPRVIRRVEPVYPVLAVLARVGAVLNLEAEVDMRGYVKTVRVLNGHPLFDEAAIEAVKQWRYQPLLLNGEPTGFILTVVITFNLRPSS
jgi:periplasmic protein TonB